jgi:putative addiction module component (TIGR02574 family)
MVMSTGLEEIEQQVRMLSPNERARLVDVLLESLRETPLAEIEAAWAREVEERVAAYDRGEVQTYGAEEVFAEVKRITR